VDAVRDMESRLKGVSEELAQSLAAKSNLYRMLYYLERIYAFCAIFKSNPEFFLVWVNVYRTFEADRHRLIGQG